MCRFDLGIEKKEKSCGHCVFSQGWDEARFPWSRILSRGFPGGAVVENLPANAGDTGSSPGLGGSHMPRSN